MPYVELPFVGQAYQERSLNLDAQTCKNFYLVSDPAGKYPGALYPRPGLTLWNDQVTGLSVRGLLPMNDNLWAVIDNKFYQINTASNSVARGTLNTTYGRVSMIDNGYQVMITDGLHGYVYKYKTAVNGNPANVFSVIDDEDFITPLTLGYQDGYGIYYQPHSQIIWITDLNDFSSVNPTSFSSSSGRADYGVTEISSQQELWLFNKITTEIWYNTGDANYTFQRRQTLLIQYGCAAPFSVVATDNSSLIWLSQNEYGNGLIVQAIQYVPQVISTPPVAAAISSYSKIDDAFAFTFQQDAHIFYVITFPTEGKTWAYEIREKSWYEWTSTLSVPAPTGNTTIQGRWRPNCYAKFAGKHIVGDFESGKLYYLDFNSYTDNTTYIEHERTSRHNQKDLQFVTINELQIDFESGTGAVTGQGNDPQVMLQYSKDNGHSWSNEMWRSVGAIGKTAHRARWLRLGTARDWVFRVRMSDPVKWVILGARVDVEVEE